MQLRGLLVVDMAHCKPNSVQVDCVGEIFQVRHNFRHLRRIGWHLGQIGRRLKIWRGREIERKRNILRDVQLRARHLVLSNEEADGVAFGSRILARSHGLVDLIAHLLAYRRAAFQPLVIAAHIQGRGHHEYRLRVGQGDGGSGRIYKRWCLLPHVRLRGSRTLVVGWTAA